MTAHSTPSNGQTRLAYILGVPLAPHCQRQWPQMGEVVSGSDLIAQVEGNFPELTLEVGRRLQLEDTIVVEWTCNYGDGRLYRNVSIAELRNGEAITVTDYWGEPTATPEWRRPLIGRLDMPRTVFGKTHNIFRTTSASEPAGACGGDKLGGGRR
jgi:hypothetical protein